MAATLPIFNTPDRILSQMQTQWSSSLNPLLSSPSLQIVLLKDIHLTAGTNVINHLLDRRQQGWRIVDINAASTIYRSQPLNDKTLTLVASAPATVSIEVF